MWTDESDVSTHRPDPGHADYSIENVHASEMTIDIDAESVSYITVHVALEQGHQAYIGGDQYPYGFPDQKGNWWGVVDFTPSDPCLTWCDCNVC